MKKTTTDDALVWQERGKKELLKTVVFTVTERDCVSHDGMEMKYVVMDAPDWVIVVPETPTGFLVVKQWRHGEKALSVEFPGGVAEAGEKPATAAARELLEETGMQAKNLIPLGTMNPNPALMSNHVHVFLATDLERVAAQSLDADERLAAYELSREEVFAMVGECAATGGVYRTMAGKSCFPHALMTAAIGLYLVKRGL